MAVQRLGDVAVETVVKLNEGGSPVNYIVVQQGSPSSDYVGFANVTSVMRQDIHSNRAFEYRNYAMSVIHSWLNGDYLNSLDADIRANVMTVKIPYSPSDETTVSAGANGLSTKAFLPSLKELNLTSSYANNMGATLSYFSGAHSEKRIAKLNGYADHYWTRNPRTNLDDYFFDIDINGDASYYPARYNEGVRPILPLNSNLWVLADGTLITNQPPTAPGSIEATNVVTGGSATITLTAATDPDGTVASYIYERQVDGGAWQQVAQVNSLTQTDAVGEEWGTVAYRACAVDDLGVSGPYVTGETYTVNGGFVTIGGPAANMGDKPAPFNFDFVCAVSGQTSMDAISVSVVRDGEVIYTGTPNSGVQVSIYNDTRFMAPGQHTIQVSASKEDYQPASSTYTFNIPAVALLPYEGKAQLPQNSAGQPVWWYGLARFIFGEGGKDLNTLLQEAKAGDLKMVTGSYQGTGQYNSANPSKIVCGFRPKFVIVLSDGSAGLGESTGILWVGSETIGSKHVTVDDTSFAWYSADSANNQLNTSGTKYFYLIAG